MGGGGLNRTGSTNRLSKCSCSSASVRGDLFTSRSLLVQGQNVHVC